MFKRKNKQAKVVEQPARRLGRAPASQARKKGLPPGALVHTGRQFTETTRISIMQYNETQLKETAHAAVGDLPALQQSAATSWVNVDGLRQVEVIESIGKVFELHPQIGRASCRERV